MDKRYRLQEKGFNIVMEKIKQRIMPQASKVKWYTGKTKQFQHNRLFSLNQGNFFKTLDGEYTKTIPPNAEEAIKF